MRFMEEVEGTFCYLQIKNPTLCKLLGDTVIKQYIIGSELDMLFTSGDFSCYYIPETDKNPCDFLIQLFEGLDGVGIAQCVAWGYYQLVRSGMASDSLDKFVQCSSPGALKKVANLIRDNRAAIQRDMEAYKVVHLDIDYSEDEHCVEYKNGADAAVQCIEADELQDLGMEIASNMPYSIPGDASLDEIIGDYTWGLVN